MKRGVATACHPLQIQRGTNVRVSASEIVHAQT